MAEGAVIIQLTRNGVTQNLISYNAESAQNVVIESKPLDLGQTDLQKYVDGFIAEFSEIGDSTMLKASLGYKDRINDTTTWLPDFDLTSQDTMLWWEGINTRYLVVKITDSAPSSRWYMTAFEVYGRLVRGNQ